MKAYPTFVVLRADGTEVYRTAGARPADELSTRLGKELIPSGRPKV